MPKRSGSGTLSTTTSTSTQNGTDTIESPTWNTSPNTRPAFLLALYKWLPSQDTRYRTLVQYGYVITPKGVNCVSDNHIDRCAAGLITAGSFKAPVIIDPKATILDSLGSANGGAGMSADQKKAWHESPTRRRYNLLPESVAELDGALFNSIAECIEDDETVEDLRTASGGSGRKLLADLEAARVTANADTTGNFGEGVLRNIARIEAEGLADATVSSYNTFKSAIAREVKTLPDDLLAGHTDSVIARKHVTAVQHLGPLIAAALNNQMQHDKSKGDLSKTKDTIIKVLSQLELEVHFLSQM